jgi:hypothetical protein
MSLEELKASHIKHHDSQLENLANEEDAINNSSMTIEEKRQAIKAIANKRFEKSLFNWQVDETDWSKILNQ